MVEDIGFCLIFVCCFDKVFVYVLNVKFLDVFVINFLVMINCCIYWYIGVIYNMFIDQFKQICDEIEIYVIKNEVFESLEKVFIFVCIDCFLDLLIDMMLYCFIKIINWGEWFEIKE